MIDPNALKSIEDLHRLKTEGIITEEEFERSKERLLFGPQQSPVAEIATAPRIPGQLPGEDDHIGWITLPLKRYADFNGRSSRKEFWMFQLLPLAIGLFVVLVAGTSTSPYGEVSGFETLTWVLAVIALLVLAVPLLAVQARRFHDQDRSGWLVLINLLPYLGAVIVYVMMALEGTKGENTYGPEPTAV